MPDMKPAVWRKTKLNCWIYQSPDWNKMTFGFIEACDYASPVFYDCVAFFANKDPYFLNNLHFITHDLQDAMAWIELQMKESKYGY